MKPADYDPAAVADFLKRKRACENLGVPMDGTFMDSVLREYSENPELCESNWEKPEEYRAFQRYSQYSTPVDTSMGGGKK